MTDLRELWLQYLSYCNDRRLDELGDYVHDEITFNDQSVTLAGYAAAIAGNIEAVPDYHWSVDDVVVQGTTVAVRLTDTGTHSRTWLGIEPTGRRFRIAEWAMYYFRGSKIAGMHFLLDTAAARDQLGASPTLTKGHTVTAAGSTDEQDFTTARAQVLRYRPQDLKAPNHNDVRAFVHAWFAAFDHAADADFFTAHLDDADMTFDLAGEPLAHDHESFRAWYADALEHFPWDFHSVIDIDITGTHRSGWTAEFFFRHVGEYHDVALSDPDTGDGRLFNRVLRAVWKVEHTGSKFLIRRYDLTIAEDVLPV